MNDNSIHFVDSTVPTQEEIQRGIEAYHSDLDFHFGDAKELIVYSDEVIQSEINNLKELGYSQEAIDYIIQSQKEDNTVILPHKLRNYREYNSVDDVKTYERENYIELKNGHALVFHLPEETERLIMQYIG